VPYQELSEESVNAVRLTEAARRSLPNGSVAIDLSEQEGIPPAKRVCVVVRWKPAGEETFRKVKLAAWRFEGSVQ
jgi:hypothetical protein